MPFDFHMLLNTLIGCMVFLLTNGSLFYASHLTVRKFMPKFPYAVRLTATGLLFYAGILGVFQALSPFHAITKTGVVLTCLIIAVVFHVLWGGHRNIRAEVVPIIIWLRAGLNSRWACLIVVCGFILFLSFSRALLMPPLSWDSLTYHLTFAATWIKQGTLCLFIAPDQIINCGHFPKNGEIFASWLLLPFHNDLLVNVMCFPITFLGGLACYAIARELGLKPSSAKWAPALICFSPMIYAHITIQNVDNAVFAFCCTAVLFTLRYLRRGLVCDGLLAFAACGILVGVKYNALPAAGLIFLAVSIKSLSMVGWPVSLKNGGVLCIGLLIVGALGGRQYIVNAVEARNPLFPMTINVLGHEVFKGYANFDPGKPLLSSREKPARSGILYSIGAELQKFSYVPHSYTKTAGPKFFIFIILAVIALFARPPTVSRKAWFFFSITWIVPILIFYGEPSLRNSREGRWNAGSTRYLSASVALFTIQGLMVFERLRKYFSSIDFVFVVFIVWDILYVNKSHGKDITVLYPLFVCIFLVTFILLGLVMKKSAVCRAQTGAPSLPHNFNVSGSGRMNFKVVGKPAFCALVVLFLFGGIYGLQSYRNISRFTYYSKQNDYNKTPVHTIAAAWSFFDNLDGKTIAASMGWKAPGDQWFLYPLFGRQLQNDVVYVSSKYKEDEPTWRHRGLLRGEDFSIWQYNLKRGNVDYVLLTRPWSIELGWMQQNEENFTLVKSDKHYQIFKYNNS